MMGERMGEDHGRVAVRAAHYEGLLASWNAQGGPFKNALNNTPKFVTSTNPATSLDWPNSTLLHGDVPASVAELLDLQALITHAAQSPRILRDR